MLKKCSKCKKRKLKKDFSNNKRAKDGKRSQCKSCAKLYTRSPEGKLKDKLTQKIYEQSEQGKHKHKKYSQSNKGKIRQKKADKKQKLKHPNKSKARDKVNGAVRYGKLPHATTLTCKCGKQAEQYHHHSYEEKYWLDVVPLCRKCHNDI